MIRKLLIFIFCSSLIGCSPVKIEKYPDEVVKARIMIKGYNAKKHAFYKITSPKAKDFKVSYSQGDKHAVIFIAK